MRKKFYIWNKGGIYAIMSKGVYQDHLKRLAIIKAQQVEAATVFNLEDNKSLHDQTIRLGTPIFTFVEQKRVEEEPWFTGSLALYNNLLGHLKTLGTVEIVGHPNKDFGMPFLDNSRAFLHVTTNEQFENTFGISIDDLSALPTDLDRC